jgi:hypothetical protein
MAHHPTSKNETPGQMVGSKKHNPRDNDKGPHEAHRHRDRKDADGNTPTSEDHAEETDDDESEDGK